MNWSLYEGHWFQFSFLAGLLDWKLLLWECSISQLQFPWRKKRKCSSSVDVVVCACRNVYSGGNRYKERNTCHENVFFGKGGVNPQRLGGGCFFSPTSWMLAWSISIDTLQFVCFIYFGFWAFIFPQFFLCRTLGWGQTHDLKQDSHLRSTFYPLFHT